MVLKYTARVLLLLEKTLTHNSHINSQKYCYNTTSTIREITYFHLSVFT